MDIFLIRNLFSIMSAENIIKEFNMKNPVAYIVKTDIEEYSEKLEKNLDKDLWRNVVKMKYSSRDFLVEKNNKIQKNNIKKILEEIEKDLKKFKIQNIYLSNIEALEEKVIWEIAKKTDIKINYYEEGTNLYTSLWSNKLSIKWIIKYFLLGNLNFLIRNKGYFKGEKLYSYFPQKYKYNNVKNKIKLKLEYSVSENERNEIEKLDIKSIFLSRPLSEDGIMIEEEEIKVIKNFLENNKTEIYVKFHPRESTEKINKMMQSVNMKLLPKELQDISAEKVIYNSKNIRKLYGYETGTLAYMSEIKDIEVYSLLERIYKNSKYLRKIYKLYKNEFNKIKFM